VAVLELLDVQQTQFAQVLRGHVGLLVQVEHLDLAVDELQDGGDRKVERECVEDRDLHVEHVFLGVGLVRDLDEVTHLRGLYLLVLAADEHAANPD